jgi:hypothetical protein
MNQKVATLAGQLTIKGWPRATKMDPTITKKYPLLMSAKKKMPTENNPEPIKKLTLNPLVSIM